MQLKRKTISFKPATEDDSQEKRTRTQAACGVLAQELEDNATKEQDKGTSASSIRFDVKDPRCVPEQSVLADSSAAEPRLHHLRAELDGNAPMASATESSSAPAEDTAICDTAGEEVCWICHSNQGPLNRTCPCNLHVHPECLARWQLRCAGNWQEQHCRFCKRRLPDWRNLVPAVDTCVEVRVVCGGKAYRLVSRPGDDYDSFQKHVWAVCGLQEGTPLELSFNFNDPFTGDTISVRGCGAFNAAIHCGAITTLEQMQGKKESQRVAPLPRA
ncbi:hypothetical protein CYMTET_30436 [Cymbomonas tetramitiformis]|uniref:RING-CH-type domain-containing protein n=1 Tax=Cymbomonas tetramitiformis TaxID=36881 RepID=A0AAE0KU74_9CHLO|nr:hypothetical protein CYMTET_30436 [Cymbomonas tetramitiformis]